MVYDVDSNKINKLKKIKFCYKVKKKKKTNTKKLIITFS